MNRYVKILISDKALYPRLNSVKIATKTFFTFLLKLINKIFKKEFIAITNPLTNTVHIIDFNEYNTITGDSVLLKHEYIHLLQTTHIGKFKFLWLYFFDFFSTFDYEKIRLELIAYKYEKYEGSYESLQKKIIDEIENLL